MKKLESLFHLEEGQLSLFLPHFLFYFILMGNLAFFDHIATVWLIQSGGAENMPYYFSLGAIASVLGMIGYIFSVHRFSHYKLYMRFLCLGVMVLILGGIALSQWFSSAIVYAIREVSFTLLLFHFSTTLQDQFNTDTFKKAVSFIYSGGRAGSIVGAGILFLLTPYFSLSILLTFSALLFGLLSLFPQEETQAKAKKESPSLKLAFSTQQVRSLIFLNLAFSACRYLLAYLCNITFSETFPDEKELTQFLSLLSQVSLLISWPFQAFYMGRIIQRFGIRKSYSFYSKLILSSLALITFFPHLITATIGRFIENEFRIAYRNPLYQITTARLPEDIRISSRAFVLGAVLPAGTLLSTLIFQLPLFFGVTNSSILPLVGPLGICSGLLHYRWGVSYYKNHFEKS